MHVDDGAARARAQPCLMGAARREVGERASEVVRVSPCLHAHDRVLLQSIPHYIPIFYLDIQLSIHSTSLHIPPTLRP